MTGGSPRQDLVHPQKVGQGEEKTVTLTDTETSAQVGGMEETQENRHAPAEMGQEGRRAGSMAKGCYLHLGGGQVGLIGAASVMVPGMMAPRTGAIDRPSGAGDLHHLLVITVMVDHANLYCRGHALHSCHAPDPRLIPDC